MFDCGDPTLVTSYAEVTLDCGGIRHVYICSEEELCEPQLQSLLDAIISCDETRTEFETDPPSQDLCP